MKKISLIKLALCLTLVFSLILGAGCYLLPEVDIDISPPPPSAPSPPPPTPTGNITPIDAAWSTPPPESQAETLPSIADVVAQVKPSVVAINTQVSTLDFFNRPATRKGAGSGWIISADGIIVTNNHVIEGAETISVTLDDGRTFLADLDTLATDPLSDLAVFHINAENLPAAKVGDSSKMRIGDLVIAIGNALGEGIRATQGIVSRTGVEIPVAQNQRLYDLLETDAAINPGNSGGPLVNMAGEVVGITSIKLAQVEVEGMGYAISTQVAMPIIKELVNNGYVVRPWLGVGLYTVDAFVIQRYNLAVEQGILVLSVAPDSPAGKAGLRVDDVITSLNGKETATAQELIRAIHSTQIGQTISITFWRGQTKDTTYASLIESPPPP